MYDVILADPPWEYKAWSKKKSRTADAHYKTMTVDEICGMGEWVQEIANKNCALFLWSTPPTIDDGLRVLRAWGFRYVTFGFVWEKIVQEKDPDLLDKLKGLLISGNKEITVPANILKKAIRKLENDKKPAIGMGHYTRANTEPCLLGIQGSMPVADKSISQVIRAPRGKHSAKPVEIHKRIELLYPKAKKIELFAREPVDGWEPWGDEVLPGLNKA